MINFPIKSYVRRESLSKAQKNILALYLPKYGLSLENATKSIRSVSALGGRQSRLPQFFEPLPENNHFWDLAKLFGREGEVIIEIGFGSGEVLVSMAQSYPDKNFLGIEVYRPGIANCLKNIAELNLNNIKLIYSDAVLVLQNKIPNNSVDQLQLFFPDPWPKRRHYKRRLIQPEFIKLIASKLKSQGMLHIATDWKEYADFILRVLGDDKNFQNLSSSKNFCPRPSYRLETKFEKRGKQLQHEVYDILFQRI